MLNSQNQLQTFGDISLGDRNVFTVNQILQVTAAAIQTQPLNPTSPYRGLKRFEPDNKDLFFGRDRLIANLVEVVSQTNFILLLGASGSGKSSLVRAGLIPQLSEKLGSKFCDFTFTPDRNPFESLGISLISHGYKQSEVENAFNNFSTPLNQGIHKLKEKGSQWLIFIDQFEEIFTLCQDLDRRKKFIDNLVTIGRSNHQSVKIILAMRADFLDRFSPYPNLGRIAQKNIHLVTDMHSDELRQAIEQPAAHHGVVFEGGLVEEIIRDVLGQAGSLPLLQYTLDLLWQNDEISDRTLNLKTYRKLGGVKGALQLHVDRIYQHLSPEEQKAAKQIFLRLIDLNATEKELDVVGKAVSRRAHLSEFNNELVHSLLNRFVDSNLLVSNRQQQSTVEIAHEILINSWSTLKEWIEDSKETIAIRNRLSEDAKRWQDSESAQDDLWSGSKLQRVEELRQKKEFDRLGGLSELENQFIDASTAERDRRLHEAEIRRKRQLTAVSIAAIVFAGLSLLAGFGWKQAERQMTILNLRERANRASNLLAIDPVQGSIESISLFGESYDRLGEKFLQIVPQVRSSLRNAIAIPVERNALRGHRGVVWSAIFSPDGKYIVSGGDDGTVRLWDRQGNAIAQPWRGHQNAVKSVAFSPDGQTIVTGSFDKTLRLWDLNGNPVGNPFQGHRDKVLSVAFSPDGKYIVSGSDDRTIRLWDKQGNPVGNPFQGHRDKVLSVAFSPDGKYIVSGSDDRTIRLWDKQGNPVGNPFQGHRDKVLSVALSPDGQTIISGSADNTIRMWNLQGNPIGKPIRGHEDFVHSVAFSPDGNYIVSASDDKTVRLWDRQGNPIGQPLIGHNYYVYSVAFSPDGQTIVSSSEDSTMRLWDRQNISIESTFYGHQAQVSTVAISPDSQYIVSGSADRTIRLWDKQGNPIGKPLLGHTAQVRSLAVSPDGQTIVSGSTDRTIRLWDRQGNPVARPFLGHESDVYSVAFSPDGQYIVSGSADRTIRLWDRQGNPVARPFLGHESDVYSVAFSPDGQYIVSASDDKTIRLWDRRGNPIAQPFLEHTDEVNAVAFSPDGKYIVSASRDKTIRLWDRQGNPIGQPFLGHGSAVTSVAFSPDGEYIVSASRDKTAQFWDLEGNSIGRPLLGHSSSVTSVAMSRDSQYIVSGSWDRTVRLWQGGTLSGWLKVACDRLGHHRLLTVAPTEQAKMTARTCQKYK
jgi:WD40 repeat protein/energy-coupling factor transporter ATP-binding protein EcfA2